MTSSDQSHSDVVRQQFSIQAPRFEQYAQALGSRDLQAWIASKIELQPHFAVLDVAAGTGILARAIAPYVKSVVALDATAGMLQAGRRQAEAEGTLNVVFEEGDAEQLPYADDTFDLVTCRIGMHHFLRPDRQASEMVRVCRAGGHVAIIDITSSDDIDLAAFHNRLERLRDPSHTRAMTADELIGITKASGLEIVGTSSADVPLNVQNWMTLTQTGSEEQRVIVQALEGELEGGPVTGMRPFREDGALHFYHSWLVLLGKKVVIAGESPAVG